MCTVKSHPFTLHSAKIYTQEWQLHAQSSLTLHLYVGHGINGVLPVLCPAHVGSLVLLLQVVYLQAPSGAVEQEARIQVPEERHRVTLSKGEVDLRANWPY